MRQRAAPASVALSALSLFLPFRSRRKGSPGRPASPEAPSNIALTSRERVSPDRYESSTRLAPNLNNCLRSRMASSRGDSPDARRSAHTVASPIPKLGCRRHRAAARVRADAEPEGEQQDEGDRRDAGCGEEPLRSRTGGPDRERALACVLPGLLAPWSARRLRRGAGYG